LRSIQFEKICFPCRSRRARSFFLGLLAEGKIFHRGRGGETLQGLRGLRETHRTDETFDRESGAASEEVGRGRAAFGDNNEAYLEFSRGLKEATTRTTHRPPFGDTLDHPVVVVLALRGGGVGCR